jgi:hypothetical protein
MWVKTGRENSLKAVFPKYALKDQLKNKSDRKLKPMW